MITGYLLAARGGRASTILEVEGPRGRVFIGEGHITMIAGPCAVESREQYLETAVALRQAGVHILRGGVFKPRTSPYSFQGMGREGLAILEEARRSTGMPVVTEVVDLRDLDNVAAVSDVVQIGSRNMQNYPLLKEAGLCCRPILLKRGLAATIEEWLLAAEYILSAGNPRVILCERGIRTFNTDTRNTLDIVAVPLIKELSHLPVLVDPSHATGRSSLVKPASLAAVAAGADGLMIEVHPHPESALSDGDQSLTLQQFSKLSIDVGHLAAVVGKTLSQ